MTIIIENLSALTEGCIDRFDGFSYEIMDDIASLFLSQKWERMKMKGYLKYMMT